MQTLNIAVCEDENAQKEKLTFLLDQAKTQNTYTVFSRGEDLLSDFEIGKYDLLLMDIYMKDSMNGIEVVQKIREQDEEIPVVFITTSKEHALLSYRLSALKYIEKPVCKKQLEEALHLALIKKEDVPSLVVKKNGIFQKVPFSDILYIEQQGRQILIYRRNICDIYYEKLSSIADQLPPELFFIPHKSFAINLSFVKQIDTELKCFIMSDNHNIPIKREFISKAKKALENYYFHHTRGFS